MLDATGPGVTVGPSILDLVTSGIYDDPLAIYREYIQNAVDELSRMDGVEGKVEITIDLRQKRVSICDNGPGLTYQECLEGLVPVAQSKKFLGRDRGFRGIGRLSGLAFAESVTFLTRTSGRDPVTRVVWSKPGLTDETNNPRATEQGFPDWVKVETLDDRDYPDRFFRVELDGVSRHSAGVLLNREEVRGYISEVCPVPLGPVFPFFKETQEIFPPRHSPYSLRVTLEGEEQPINRQYTSTIVLAGNKEDHFQEFEEVRVPSIDGAGDAALGWIAHSSYIGAIPKGNRIRGIRARLGNIQIGDERIFDHLFEEERFNHWSVGEVHILDPRIVPNCRRDYFERDSHLRNLENHLAPIFRQISARCRAASSDRNKQKKLVATILDLEAMFDSAASGCLTPSDAGTLVEQAMQGAAKAKEELGTCETDDRSLESLTNLEEKLRRFHPNGCCFPLSGISSSEVDTYRRVFGAVATTVPSARSALEIIETVLRESDSGLSVV